MRIKGNELRAQYERAVRDWPFIHDVEAERGIPRFLLFAIGSRETNLRNIRGDKGHGRGVFQLDDRWHDIPPGFDDDVRLQANKAADVLLAFHRKCGNWKDALSGYNSGKCSDAHTTGKDYGADVMERWSFLGGDVPRFVSVIDAIRAQALQIEEVGGWRERGSATFGPRGVVCHHTAGPAGGGDYPSLRIVRDGRSDLPGPLAQFGLGRSGKVYVIAAGRANHAGRGGWKGLSGNSSVWGIEAENNGYQPWPAAQLDAYHRLCAALCRFSRIDPSMVCGHKEWAPGRKPDPHSLDMNDFRQRVAALLHGAPPPPRPLGKVKRMVLIRLAGTPHIYTWDGQVLNWLPDGQSVDGIKAGLKQEAIGDVSQAFLDAAVRSTVQVFGDNDFFNNVPTSA